MTEFDHKKKSQQGQQVNLVQLLIPMYLYMTSACQLRDYVGVEYVTTAKGWTFIF